MAPTADDDLDELSVDRETGELKGRRCSAQKTDGSGQCSVRALPGSEFCVFHSPDFEEDQRRGRSLAGRKPTLKRLPGMSGEVNSPEDVLRICNTLLKTLLERDASPGSIAAISRVLALCLDTMTGIQMEQRVSALEVKADAIEG